MMFVVKTRERERKRVCRRCGGKKSVEAERFRAGASFVGI